MVRLHKILGNMGCVETSQLPIGGEIYQICYLESVDG